MTEIREPNKLPPVDTFVSHLYNRNCGSIRSYEAAPDAVEH